MLFIGICGASGSGKSTLAEELATMVNKSILIINQDAYYKDHPDLSFEERCLLNYDEPSIFDHDQLLEDVQDLLEGRRVSKKRYDYSHHCRADVPGEYLEPHDVIIVEGIHAFYDARLRAMICMWNPTSACCGASSAISTSAAVRSTISPRSISRPSSRCSISISAITSNTPTSSSPAEARMPRSRKSSPDISTTICTSIAA